jgi:cell wall-associated NlpC family hydrolase
VKILEGQVGKPYIPNGESTKGFDCSGFLSWGLKRVGGPAIPSYTLDQFKLGRPVEVKNLRPGDAIFFKVPTDAHNPGHVAIYAGKVNGVPMVVNAANHRDGVAKQPLTHFTSAYSIMGARRYLPSR